uniref:Uncharacterized protein LOC104235521 n=1 Tax=Nicotiana sylvestris TaxID=4096 RepID=A0A1U7XKY5_NICSY|nr:PREDICTED: uncharacterized protein LOC104235521 [Nicotiana sylvestris]
MTEKGANRNEEIEESDEGEGNNFSSYHLQTLESDFDEDLDDSEGPDSLFDIDENIEECSDLEDDIAEIRQPKLNKKKDAQVNVDEIPSGPIGIDAGFEDMHKNKRRKYEGKLGGDGKYFDSSDPGSECSDDERELVCPDEIREALQTYSIKKGVNLKLKPNEKEMVRAKCTKKGCPWHILGSIEGSTCNFRTTLIVAIDSLRSSLHSSTGRAQPHYRATRSSPSSIFQSTTNQPAPRTPEPRRAEAVAAAVASRSSPSNTITPAPSPSKVIVWVVLVVSGLRSLSLTSRFQGSVVEEAQKGGVTIRTYNDSIPGKEVFIGIYVCLEALKTGWLERCRNIIGFAFLKGTCKSELLCLKESKDTWSWFIRCLKHDLNLTETEGEGLMVMSDMQKGLHLAITQLLPNTEMRWCARHIWANWKQAWPSEERRKKFW